jgi:L-2-hydroxycarboxylate dehydrogenase (NAD+)
VLRPKRRQLGPFRAALALRREIPARRVGKGIGHFFGALQIDAFIDKGEFKKQIDDWIQVFRNAKTDPGTNGPLISGDLSEKLKRSDACTEFLF